MDQLITRAFMQRIRQAFALDWRGIHGAPHWARVHEIGLRLAEQTGAKVAVVRLFAFLHDSQRRHDGRDAQHGHRAARFALELRGRLFDLPDSEFELLLAACRDHSDGLLDADITVQTCWDADRLDLGRVGIRPDPRRLCTAPARHLVEWAYRRSMGRA